MGTYNVKTSAITARPRSNRLRELGSSAAASQATAMGGGAVASGDGHTHANKAALDALSIDQDNYVFITQKPLDGDSSETLKVKAGFADEAAEAQHAANSDLWDEKAFGDYLNQALRTNDIVLFREVIAQAFRIPRIVDGLIDGFNAQVDDAGNADFNSVKSVGTVEAPAVESPDPTLGPLGTGFKIWMQNGKSMMEIDNILVRMSAVFNTLTIAELKSVGGQIVISSADIKCTLVESVEGAYRCFFDNDGGNIINQFAVGDQARCQRFTGAGMKYYWRKVNAVGVDYIDLSTTDHDGNGVPEKGDSIVQLGHRTDSTRQNAILISAYGTDAPSLKQYSNIHAFNLTGCETTVISPSGNTLVGKLYVKSGSSTTRVPSDCGAWVQGREYGYYDRVSDAGALWLCTIEEGTTTIERPGAGADWEKQVAEGESPIQVTILSSQGNIFRYNVINTTLTAKVYRGGEDITDSLSQDSFRWVRISDNSEEDAVWNAAHANFGSNILNVSGSDVTGRATFNCNVTINN